MNFLKKHWLALLILGILLYAFYAASRTAAKVAAAIAVAVAAVTLFPTIVPKLIANTVKAAITPKVSFSMCAIASTVLGFWNSDFVQSLVTYFHPVDMTGVAPNGGINTGNPPTNP